MKTIHAVYEKGVFRPKERVDLPEHCEVEVSLTVVPKPSDQVRAMKEIRATMSQTFETNQPHLAEQHNEHQP